MGLDLTAADLLRAAHSRGASFEDVLTLGRQNLDVPGYDSEFAEPFLRELGATNVTSLDYSDFEGAGLIHDLNDPIPKSLHGRFSLVFDGGTIEHVFNAPQAYRNAMNLLTVGGFFVGVGPGNNFMGHGFWQASPELFYRMFSSENGFECLGVFVHEFRQIWSHIDRGQYFLAHDPARLGWRVELRNHWPTNLCVLARKVAEVPPFESWPQQSDYAALWNSGEGTEIAQARWKTLIRKVIPQGVERMVRPTFANKAYSPIKNADLLSGKF